MQAFLLSAVRTPVGTHLGDLSSLTAPQLGAVAITECLSRPDINPEFIDGVIMGNVLSAGLGQAPARQAALLAGLPPSVSALTINKMCGSGLKAVMLAAQAIRAGDAHAIVAGGMESMSRAPHLLEDGRAGRKLGHTRLLDSLVHDGLTCPIENSHMGVLADRTAREMTISREDQDHYACESQQRAFVARESGAFRDEIAVIEVHKKSGLQTVDKDQGLRPGTNIQTLATLQPAFQKGGTVTAGNSSQISDGAAVVLIVSEEFAATHGRTPLARILGCATAGVAPRDVCLAPVPAIHTVLAKTGLAVGDIDLFEINEAFAAQTLACQKFLALPADKLNVHGGAIALGHPLGASGARVLVTLVHALRQRGGRRGLAALCLGGGNAVAMIVELNRAS